MLKVRLSFFGGQSVLMTTYLLLIRKKQEQQLKEYSTKMSAKMKYPVTPWYRSLSFSKCENSPQNRSKISLQTVSQNKPPCNISLFVALSLIQHQTLCTQSSCTVSEPSVIIRNVLLIFIHICSCQIFLGPWDLDAQYINYPDDRRGQYCSLELFRQKDGERSVAVSISTYSRLGASAQNVATRATIPTITLFGDAALETWR